MGELLVALCMATATATAIVNSVVNENVSSRRRRGLFLYLDDGLGHRPRGY